MRLTGLFAALFAAASVSSAAHAQNDKYHFTDKEKAACLVDATRLCSYTYPDEDKLLVCMQANRSELSSACAVILKAGMRRRHLS